MQRRSTVTRAIRKPRPRHLVFAAALAVLALAGCGPTAPIIAKPVPNPHRFALQLSPSQVSVTAGGTVHLSVTTTRDPGFTDPITLTLNGAPDGVTAAFTPDLSQPDHVDVALQAAVSVVPYSYGLAISGASGIEQEDATFTALVQDPVTFDVQGRVVDLFRQPVPNASVSIGGSAATSAADGSFTISSMTRPYDVIVTPAGKSEVHEFLGLQRSNPVLPLLDQVSAPPRSATVAGTLAGAAANGTREVTEFAFSSPEAHGATVLWAGLGPSFGPFPVSWFGAPTTQGSLAALKWNVGPDGLPKQYLGFASSQLSLTDQQAVAGADIQLAPLGTSYISGTVTSPLGFSLTRKTLWLTAGPKTGMILGIAGTPSLLFTFATPVAGLPLGVEVDATSSAGATTSVYRANLSPNQVIDLTLPLPPGLTSPGPGAVNVDHTTSFAWTAVADTISVLSVTSAAGPSGFIYTSGASGTLPPASAFALPSSAASYQWSVVAWGMADSMDAFTDPAAPPGSFGLGADALVAIAAPSSFMTAPSP